MDQNKCRCTAIEPRTGCHGKAAAFTKDVQVVHISIVFLVIYFVFKSLGPAYSVLTSYLSRNTFLSLRVCLSLEVINLLSSVRGGLFAFQVILVTQYQLRAYTCHPKSTTSRILRSVIHCEKSPASRSLPRRHSNGQHVHSTRWNCTGTGTSTQDLSRTPTDHPQDLHTYLRYSCSIMCDYEEFHFACGHRDERLLSYCHFARTDPINQCYGVKVIKAVWVKQCSCQFCIDAIRTAMRGQQTQQGRR